MPHSRRQLLAKAAIAASRGGISLSFQLDLAFDLVRQADAAERNRARGREFLVAPSGDRPIQNVLGGDIMISMTFTGGRLAVIGRAASPSEKTARPDVVSWLRDEVKRRMTRLTLDEMYYDSMKARPTRNPPTAPSTRLQRDLDYDLIGLSAPTMLMALRPRVPIIRS